MIDISLKKPLLPRIFGLALLLCAALAGTLALAGPASAASTGAVAWGANGAGQLGDGTNSGPEGCNLEWLSACSIVPVAVSGLSEAKSVAAGSYHGLALLNDGAVMAWGDNGFGQLGTGSTTGPETCENNNGESTFPCSRTPAVVGGLSEVTAVAAGELFSLALLKNGTVMGWGSNDAGVLGNLTTGISTVPIAVGGLSEVTAIAAGRDYGLALLKNGTVMAWGDNASGQLGASNITGPKACGTCSPTPVVVSGLSEVVAIAAGREQSLALLKNGTVMAWGANEAGQLGDGTTTGSDVPVPVSGISEATAIAAGGRSSFALLKNGTVMAWGEDNISGQLGAGNVTGPRTCECSATPGVVGGISEATAIAAGETTSLALLKNGTVMAWRARSGVVSNGQGELGDGTTTATESNVPVTVDGLSKTTAIAAGGRFNLAIGALAPLPAVTKLEPGSGPASGGTLVRITGSHFTAATAVMFGSTAATSFTIDSDTEITAVSPPGSGTVHVTVQAAGGTSVVGIWVDSFAFAYGPPETETSTGSGVSSGSSSEVLGVNTIGSHVGEAITPKVVLTRAQKLAKALKQCETQPKHKRAVCAKQARREYATTAKRRGSRQTRRGTPTGQRIHSGH